MDYEAVFAATPTPQLLLDADFVIVDVNDALLAATGQRRESLLGRAVFAAFPDNPQENGDGVSNLRASLMRAWATGSSDTMPPQRYDIPDPAGGSFLQRYWSPMNVPVLDGQGQVQLLLHRVVDISDLVPDPGPVEVRRQDELAQAERSERGDGDLSSELKIFRS